MSKEIKLTADELMLMSMFHTLTGIRPMHCILEDNNVFYIVDKEDVPKLIAESRHIPAVRKNIRKGSVEKVVFRELMKELNRTLRKNVYIIKFSNNPVDFLRNFFMLRYDESIDLVNRGNRKYAVVRVLPRRRGFVIGRGGFRARIARDLVKKYFDLDTVLIK